MIGRDTHTFRYGLRCQRERHLALSFHDRSLYLYVRIKSCLMASSKAYGNVPYSPTGSSSTGGALSTTANIFTGAAALTFVVFSIGL